MSLPSNSDLVNRVVAMRPALVRRAASLLGARTHIGTPEDFAQDAIVVALQSLDGFADESLSGWMAAMLQNCIRNAARRAHVKTSVSLYRPETGGDDSADAIDFPVAAAQGERLELVDVMEALNKLSAADQEIIWIGRVEGLSHAQIAQKLHAPLGTLHSRLARATARMRDVYETVPATVAGYSSADLLRAA